MRERELSLEYKAKELELHNTRTRTAETTEIPFDVGKRIYFVPLFQESKVDKYFMHFEKVIICQLKVARRCLDNTFAKCLCREGTRNSFSLTS